MKYCNTRFSSSFIQGRMVLYKAHERLSHTGVWTSPESCEFWLSPMFVIERIFESADDHQEKRIEAHEAIQKYKKCFAWMKGGCISGADVSARCEPETFYSTALLQSGTREEVVENNKKIEIILCENRMDNRAKNDYTVPSN